MVKGMLISKFTRGFDGAHDGRKILLRAGIVAIEDGGILKLVAGQAHGTFFRELDRIADEVGNNLAETGCVGLDGLEGNRPRPHQCRWLGNRGARCRANANYPGNGWYLRLIKDEQHVVPWRASIGIGWGRDRQGISVDLEWKKVYPLILIKGMSH